ncbi:pilus assembly protein TadG-related protein [Kocuria flava]|uniref:pilus assembly protein TadG-related protein n=1 Tax=Kocuria flava TaxID=446860 RepID=UPI001FF2BA0F|nr:pilus assembly protein TadG-related protein [Kocuria flava]MCJ8503650.1 pilus assembly protein TadG-related protein [Kocuria flava]
MRRLIDHLQRSAAVHRDAGERGAVAVLTALTLVVLLGFVALAVDVGLLYAERAELQSGADAAALAIARDCGQGVNCTPDLAAPIAQQMADANAGDGKAAASTPVFEGNTVRTTVSSRDKSGAGSLALSFAPLIGADDRATVSATASAAWGAPLSGIAIWPVAFAECEFDLSGKPQALTLGAKGGTLCSKYNSDGDLNPPGGFGWIGDDKDGSCSQQVSVGSQIQSTGTSLPQDCNATLAKQLENRTILIPVYDDKVGQGSNGYYDISGWAAFHIEGYTFTGNVSWEPQKVTQFCNGSCDGIYGRFVRFTSFDEGFTIGPPSSFGVSVVDLRE